MGKRKEKLIDRGEDKSLPRLDPPSTWERPKAMKKPKTIDELVAKRPAKSCTKCGCGKRKDLGKPLVQPYDGMTAEGKAFAAIVRQRCRCLGCGQTRFDAIYLSPQDSEELINSEKVSC